MDTYEVTFLAESDRGALCRMLQASHDFPQQLLFYYRRRGGFGTFVAWSAGEVVGVLNGSFRSNLSEIGTFDLFVLPPGPHALLDRVHVHESARGVGVGRALVEAFTGEAAARECTFVGGLVDDSSDSTARRAFFERLGFSIRDQNSFGARLSQILPPSKLANPLRPQVDS